MITETQAYEAIRDAQIHAQYADMRSSAELCVSDALALFNKGDYKHAHQRALRSLAYSVGRFSPLYVKHCG